MNKKIFIIAEAGVNHNGSLKIAKKMVDAAAEAGVDAIKFQTFTAEKIVTRNAPKAGYQRKTTSSGESQFAMLKRLELNFKEHKELMAYCREVGILFLSSPFDLESIDMLNRLGLKVLKIPSGEITNLPYLEKIGSLKKKIIMSTGMAGLGEVKAAIDILKREGTLKKNITVLHCTSEYPTSFNEVNLRAMAAMRDTLGVDVGYSDHTVGYEAAIAAATLSATVIEKHFTLDRDMRGPDHKASLEPDELRAMIKAIRNIERAMGDGIKRPALSESRNKGVIRKSIVASKNIRKGEYFTAANIAVKRPGTGISPMRWNDIIGKAAKRDFDRDEMIEL